MSRTIIRLLLSLGLALSSCQSNLPQDQQNITEQKKGQATSVSETLLNSSEGQPPTWKEFVNQGGSRYIRVDFELPTEFNQGLVYFNRGANVIQAFILKKGLDSYPQKRQGLDEIAPQFAQEHVRQEKAIALQWNLGNSALQFAGDPSIRFPQPGQGCLRNLCLTAPFLNQEAIAQILRSQHPIENAPE